MVKASRTVHGELFALWLKTPLASRLQNNYRILALSSGRFRAKVKSGNRTGERSTISAFCTLTERN